MIGDTHQLEPIVELSAQDESRVLRSLKLGSSTRALEPFRMYENLGECFDDYVDVVAGRARYADAVAARGRDQPLFERVNEDLQDKGFVVAQLDNLVNWTRAGSPQRLGTHPGNRGDQLFFVAFAQSWCALTTPENERMRLVRDSHSPPRYRVNATLQNMPAFHDAFQCAPQTPMRNDNVCEIW